MKAARKVKKHEKKTKKRKRNEDVNVDDGDDFDVKEMDMDVRDDNNSNDHAVISESSSSPSSPSSSLNDAKKDKKKKKKKDKKRKRSKISNDDDDDDADGSSSLSSKADLTSAMKDENDNDNDKQKKSKKEKKASKKDKKSKKKNKKKQRKLQKEEEEESGNSDDDNDDDNSKKNKNKTRTSSSTTTENKKERVAVSSKIEFYEQKPHPESVKPVPATATTIATKTSTDITILLFYQYVEPVWDESMYEYVLNTLRKYGDELHLTGRMRVAKEGLNCSLTGKDASIREYCHRLRTHSKFNGVFQDTEFKLTTDLPLAQKFTELKVFKVVELVHYGLEGRKAPPIAQYHGTHLEPKDYHKKLAENNTVIIDVRNHYEAAIGRFVPPQEQQDQKQAETDSKKRDEEGDAPKWLDPLMRKSTEFPVWLDKQETKEEMKGKQVLMYCTGGIRCERASALLKYKMETDPEIKSLGIKGVYQLQGGIDKYFKEFPDGGYWQGKNYVFDKRFSHAPPKVDGMLHSGSGGAVAKTKQQGDGDTTKPSADQISEERKQEEQSNDKKIGIMGKCEACHKPWDM